MTDITASADDMPLHRQVLMGGQMLFVAFGALVLVPILTGLDPNVAFFTAGIGTLIFQLCTKRQVPIFLASSFAFIAPITFSIQQWGLPATMGGMMAAGFFYVFLSGLVRTERQWFPVSPVPACGCGSGDHGDWSRSGASGCEYGQRWCQSGY